MKNRLFSIILLTLVWACSDDKQSALYQQALEKYNNEDLMGAKVLLDSILRADPDFIDAYSLRGDVLIIWEDYNGAISDLTQGLGRSADSTNHSVLFLKRGQAYYASGKLDEADQDLTRAIAIIPDLAQAYYLRGLVSADRGFTSDSMQDLLHAVQLDSAFTEAHVALANYYLSVPNYNMALNSFTRAIALDGSNPDYYLERGNVFYDQGEFDMAIGDYSTAIDVDDSYVDAYINRGNAKDEIGLASEALLDYDRAIELEPDYGSSYFNRGIVKQNAGDDDGACADFKKALELGYINALVKMGNCP